VGFEPTIFRSVGGDYITPPGKNAILSRFKGVIELLDECFTLSSQTICDF
jgi:hypothetical protein